jgi:hypothetical protein
MLRVYSIYLSNLLKKTHQESLPFVRLPPPLPPTSRSSPFFLFFLCQQQQSHTTIHTHMMVVLVNGLKTKDPGPRHQQKAETFKFVRFKLKERGWAREVQNILLLLRFPLADSFIIHFLSLKSQAICQTRV